MNTTIALRSLVGASLIAAVAAGCGAERASTPPQAPAPQAQPSPSDLDGCGLTADQIDRIIAQKTHSLCRQEQRHNHDMHRVHGHG